MLRGKELDFGGSDLRAPPMPPKYLGVERVHRNSSASSSTSSRGDISYRDATESRRSQGSTPHRLTSKNNVVGDIKCTLDDMKSSYLKYYTKVFSLDTSIPVEHRLQMLGDHSYPGVSYTSSGERMVYRQKMHTTSIDELMGDEEEKEEKKGGVGKYVDGGNSRKNEQKRSINMKSNKTKEFDATNNFVGSLNMRRGDDSSMKTPQSVFPPTRPEQSANQIAEMLQDMKEKTMSTTRRLEGVREGITAEIGDPNIREWELRTAPKLRKRASLGNNAELKNHITNLYASLHAAAQINEQKIAALSAQMKVLQINTKYHKLKAKDDPRVGF